LDSNEQSASCYFSPVLQRGSSGSYGSTRIWSGSRNQPEPGSKAPVMEQSEGIVRQCTRRSARHSETIHSGMNDGLPVLAVCPPSATNAAPVTNEAKSEAKKRITFAISSGRPRRPIGMVSLNFSANPAWLNAGASNGVSIAPGRCNYIGCHSAHTRLRRRA
jgi:hypothetical protein